MTGLGSWEILVSRPRPGNVIIPVAAVAWSSDSRWRWPIHHLLVVRRRWVQASDLRWARLDGHLNRCVWQTGVLWASRSSYPFRPDSVFRTSALMVAMMPFSSCVIRLRLVKSSCGRLAQSGIFAIQSFNQDLHGSIRMVGIGKAKSSPCRPSPFVFAYYFHLILRSTPSDQTHVRV